MAAAVIIFRIKCLKELSTETSKGYVFALVCDGNAHAIILMDILRLVGDRGLFCGKRG